MKVAISHTELKVREGLSVWRRGDGTVVKQASTEIEQSRLRRERLFLEELHGTMVAPEVISGERDESGHFRLTIQDLGDSEPVTEPWLFARNACYVLWHLHDRQIKHGDLTESNIIVRDNRPMVFDWGESRHIWEHLTDKRPEPDSEHLWKAVLGILGCDWSQ